MTFDIASRYLPDMSIDDFQRRFSSSFPELDDRLWLDRPGRNYTLGPMFAQPNEFETNVDGRGESFRRAHKQSMVKAVGVRKLLEQATGSNGIAPLPSDFVLLDVLGGDGTVARAASHLSGWNSHRHWILTADLSAQMVKQAMAYGLPAVRLAAQFLLCRDRSFDAVLIAYGTHHIPTEQRAASYADALRVLRPGGRLVVHDFAVGSPTAKWFETVVDAYSPNGHAYSHFVPAELEQDLKSAGFNNIEVGLIYDPIVVHTCEAGQARRGILSYLIDSYGLHLVEHDPRNPHANLEWVEQQVSNCIRYDPAELTRFGDVVPEAVRESGTFSVFETRGGWVGELPRTAVVAVAQKD